MIIRIYSFGLVQKKHPKHLEEDTAEPRKQGKGQLVGGAKTTKGEGKGVRKREPLLMRNLNLPSKAFNSHNSQPVSARKVDDLPKERRMWKERWGKIQKEKEYRKFSTVTHTRTHRQCFNTGRPRK